MVDEDDSHSGKWEETGAFPRMSSSPNNSEAHIFTDEPFEGGFTSLEAVQEGSRETSESAFEDVMALSTVPTTTASFDDRQNEATLGNSLENRNNQINKPTKLTDVEGATHSYPFNVQESLNRLDDKRQRQQAISGDLPSSTSRKSLNTSFASNSSASYRLNRQNESMPSPLTPMTYGEEASIVSEEQSNTVEPDAAAGTRSVMSTRSHQRSTRYIVRHTLSTSQQVNANPSMMLKNLFVGVEQERHMHKLAGQNLHAVHNWFIFLPCVLLTLLSGTVVLVFEADLDVSDETKVYASIFVGVASLFAVFLQAVGKMLNMGTRGTLHDLTSLALKRISEDIILTLSSMETIPSEYVALISEKFGQALDSCPSPFPYKLEAAFSSISDRMELILKPPTGQPARKYVNKLDLMRLYSTMYDELNAEIIHSWAWPFIFPRPRSASEAALGNFKAIITEGRDLKRRQGFFRFFCPCASSPANERGLFDVVPAASVAESTNTGYQSKTTAQQHHSQQRTYPIRSSMLGQEV